MEALIRLEHQRQWRVFLFVQKELVESCFDWLKLKIDYRQKALIGTGQLKFDGVKKTVFIHYSPFNKYRYDRIWVDDSTIKYNDDIHLYNDLSLCLYHPIIDQPMFQKVPLVKIIPWISEWLVFYKQWKKYGVWLGLEIKHRF